MKLLLLLFACVGLACKTTQAKPQTVQSKSVAAKPGDKEKAKSKHPEIESVSASVLLPVSTEKAWALVSGVEDWGAWNERVTRVEPGLGLGKGATILWAWDDIEVKSTVVTVRNGEEFSFRPTASSKRALMRWILKPQGRQECFVALKAEVPYGTAGEIMEKLKGEVQEWVAALQGAAVK